MLTLSPCPTVRGGGWGWGRNDIVTTRHLSLFWRGNIPKMWLNCTHSDHLHADVIWFWIPKICHKSVVYVLLFVHEKNRLVGDLISFHFIHLCLLFKRPEKKAFVAIFWQYALGIPILLYILFQVTRPFLLSYCFWIDAIDLISRFGSFWLVTKLKLFQLCRYNTSLYTD